MQIILVHPGLTQARSIRLKSHHLLLVLFCFISLVLISSAAVIFVAGRHAPAFAQFLIAPASTPVDDPAASKDRYVRENIAAMAVKLGEMQAQMMRLDALGERVQGLAGIKPESFNFREKPGRGGVEFPGPPVGKGAELNLSTFRAALDAMARDMEHRADYLNVVETALMSEKIQFKLLPTVQPVALSYNASGFGWRIDPFSGRQAFHSGIDFPGPAGTPVVAAAGGVVVGAEYHPQYGNQLELDHGNGISTRYAHASRLLVKLGDIVRRGEHIADLGSSGRSTGAHLHFEVLVRNVHQDPHKFLSAGAAAQARMLATNR